MDEIYIIIRIKISAQVMIRIKVMIRKHLCMVTMERPLIGREGLRDCNLIGWPGPEEAQASQSGYSHVTPPDQSEASP